MVCSAQHSGWPVGHAHSVIAAGGQASRRDPCRGQHRATTGSPHCERGPVSLAHYTLTLDTVRLRIKKMRGKDETFQKSPVVIGQIIEGGKKKVKETPLEIAFKRSTLSREEERTLLFFKRKTLDLTIAMLHSQGLPGAADRDRAKLTLVYSSHMSPAML